MFGYLKNIVVLLLLLPAMVLSAQTLTALPYYENFENGVGDWVLCNGDKCPMLTNKWCISDNDAYIGKHSLVLSNDGRTPQYANEENWSVAYREFTLESGNNYTLSFNWKCLGEEGEDGFYVGWFPQSTELNSTDKGRLDVIVNKALQFGEAKPKLFSGKFMWQYAQTQIRVPRGSSSPGFFRLYFVWKSNARTNASPSACIDNISIVSEKPKAPDKFVYTQSGSDVSLSWLSAAADIELMYRSQDAYGNITVDTVQPTEARYDFTDLDEAWYDFYVRTASASGEVSAWAPITEVLVMGGNHCINFADLKAPGVVCTYGNFGESGGANHKDTVGVVDNGPLDYAGSRHTMHYMPGETDPFTTDGSKPGLKTIPDGELASIRIGNSLGEEGGGIETITYEYPVSRNEKTILMVNYAIVYASPKHTTAENPYFRLEILDENDRLINDDGLFCNQAYFYPPDSTGSVSDGWNEVDGTDFNLFGATILWQDWKSMGINLSQFGGQTVKIRFTMRDCVFNTHFAHAFFTISCAKAELSGYTCGESADGRYTVSAPPGFGYRWFKDGTERDENGVPKEICGTGQEFSASSDSAGRYYCDVMFLNKSECYFPLYADLVSREPLSAFKPQHTPRYCNNYMTLHNTGGILSDGKLLPDATCDLVEWTVRNVDTGKDTVFVDYGSPILPVPDEGGNYEIELFSSIADKCSSPRVKKAFSVPPIGRREANDTVSVCRDKLPYKFLNGRRLYKAGEYTDSVPNPVSGCDSVVHLKLVVTDPRTVAKDTTICYGDTLWVNSQPLWRTGEFPFTINSDNPDSCNVVMLYRLTVRDEIVLDIGAPDIVCADMTELKLPLSVVASEAAADATVGIEFSQEALAAGFENILDVPFGSDTVYVPMPLVEPGYYSVKVLYRDSLCGVFTDSVDFTVQYPSNIIAQKWNDVLALLNGSHGGYDDCTHYQWYKNGEPIQGANDSYLYIGADNSEFVDGDAYSVELARTATPTPIMSCPFEPERREGGGAQYPTLLSGSVSQQVALNVGGESGCARWFSLSGPLFHETVIPEGSDAITLPPMPGIYLLHVVLPAETFAVKVTVFEN